MSRFKPTASTCALALLIVAACSTPDGFTGVNANGGASPEASVVAPETPAPFQNPARASSTISITMPPENYQLSFMER